ncbi:MAG TPA: metal ABC transporter substrate-binding protein [Segeticoccus sp.]|uniref:metal ABC transporter substrate-binding protein n=1 Tax=Segeticoccus sp. TaxID=2706531 RepID=UPI002D7EF591|nr:metal ABC transporter substrate-binding protein [Segeticoccus sp.]HET8600483.1 metal ABC transporter substrate-binding protein [Segeticoccus sp.]
MPTARPRLRPRHGLGLGSAAAAALLALLLALVLAGCGGTATATSHRVQVVAAFYPLQYAVQQVGGDHVDVTSLTKPGVEPHELELTPQDVAHVVDADLVVYEQHFQPAVDQAVEQEAPDHSLDVAPAAHLDLRISSGIGRELPDEPFAGHADEAGAIDPHFWLDPIRYADVGHAIADRLAQLDPAHAADYRAGAARFSARLHRLDHAFRSGLAHCRNDQLVTSHSAFGYLAHRYGLTQVGITGLSPDVEPDPRTLADVADYVRQHHVGTVYSETLASPAVARAVASETGAHLAVLDPIEGLTDQSAGRTYFAIMRANLRTLQKGQGCS